MYASVVRKLLLTIRAYELFTVLLYEYLSVAGPRIWNNLPASLRQPDIQ